MQAEQTLGSVQEVQVEGQSWQAFTVVFAKKGSLQLRQTVAANCVFVEEQLLQLGISCEQETHP